MPVDTRWFRDRLADRQMSQRGLARALGLDAAAVSLMLRGKRAMRMTEAADIARLLGVPAGEVMKAAGVRASTSGESVPVIGFVDGAGEAHWQDDGSVPHPGGDMPAAVHAVQCKTGGTQLDHMDGWLLFCASTAPNGVQADAVGRLSFCRLRNGVIFLAVPKHARTRGRWDLSGPGSTAAGVDLEWAVPVLSITP